MARRKRKKKEKRDRKRRKKREFKPAEVLTDEGMSKSDLSDVLLALIDKFEGRVRTTVRDPTGAIKLLTVVFGSRSWPSYTLEIRDHHHPEDPLAREKRLADSRRKKHENRRKAIAHAVKEALLKQKAELLGGPDGAEATGPAVKSDDERWSKRNFTDTLQALLETGPTADFKQHRDGSNVVFLKDGDQVLKVTVSMPRKHPKF